MTLQTAPRKYVAKRQLTLENWEGIWIVFAIAFGKLALPSLQVLRT